MIIRDVEESRTLFVKYYNVLKCKKSENRAKTFRLTSLDIKKMHTTGRWRKLNNRGSDHSYFSLIGLAILLER